MKSIKHLALLTGLALVLAACSLPGGAPPEPSATPEPTVTPTVAPTAPPRLDEAALRGGTYFLPVFNRAVTLVDGKHEEGQENERMTAVMLPQIAWGDLDGDGLEDAALLIGENGGGSGTFVSLHAVLNRGGQAVQASSVMIDDRPRTDTLAIEGGEIVYQGVIHAPDDVMINPTLAVIEAYVLEARGLRLAHFASGVVDGPKHTITIEAPAAGAQAGGSVSVRGSMPMGPFENNLRLRIYAENSDVLYEGPFAVQTDTIGGPAVFDNAVDLSIVPAGARALLELAEISMKDGSVMALDTVWVTRGGD